MSEIKSWKLPDPPDESVAALRDGTGRVFIRVSADGRYWASDELGPGRGTYEWSDLLFQRGEMSEGELR